MKNMGLDRDRRILRSLPLKFNVGSSLTSYRAHVSDMSFVILDIGKFILWEFQW